MSASRTPRPTHAFTSSALADEPDAFTAPPIRIGAYHVWFAYDVYTEPDALTVYIDLGKPAGIDLSSALNLMLSLCLDLHDASRGVVIRHPAAERLIYRFGYALDADPLASRLIDAMAVLVTQASVDAAWTEH